MYLEQPLDDVSHAIDVGRRRLASVDLGSIAESALAGARAATPDRLSRKERRSRWPFVAVALIVGSFFVALLYVVPLWRRSTEEPSSVEGEGSPSTRPDGEPDGSPERAGALTGDRVGGDSDGS